MVFWGIAARQLPMLRWLLRHQKRIKREKLIKLGLDNRVGGVWDSSWCITSESTCEQWREGRVGVTVSMQMGTSIKTGSTQENSLLAKAMW